MRKNALALTASYAAIQFFFWFAYGTALAYASPYLLACGLSNTAIGLINAAACALSVLIQPALAAYADKPKSPSLKRILTCLLGMMLLFDRGLRRGAALPLHGAGRPRPGRTPCLAGG